MRPQSLLSLSSRLARRCLHRNYSAHSPSYSSSAPSSQLFRRINHIFKTHLPPSSSLSSPSPSSYLSSSNLPRIFSSHDISPSTSHRNLSTSSSTDTDDQSLTCDSSDGPYRLYKNVRRFQSLGLSLLAGGQVCFWGYAAGMSTTTATSAALISPAWTVGGLGLSVLFGWMVTAYLRRLVAYVDLLNVNGPVIRVTPHSVLGRLGKPVDIQARSIIPGPMHDRKEETRHWTFGIKNNPKSKIVFFYILDMKHGVVDRDALACLVDGPEKFVVWSYKRDAGNMKKRWKHWKNGENQTRSNAQHLDKYKQYQM